MGLLDWLTDLGGSAGSGVTNDFYSGGQSPPLDQPAPAPSPVPPQPTQPMPPVQQVPPLPPPTTIAPAPQPATPMPQPSPAPQPPMQPPMQPPSAAPAAPGMPTSQPTNPGQGRGFLGQAFGLKSSDEKNMLGSLGAGLQSVGQNWNKPGLAAFAGSAGAAIEGGTKAEEKRVDEMLKLIDQKRKAGDESPATSLAQVKLETAKLQLQNLKDGNGKGTAWNKPPEERYTNAMHDLANDPDVKASADKLRELRRNGSAEEIAKAEAEHKDLIAAVRDQSLIRHRLDPVSAAAMAKVPGLTFENPHLQNSYTLQNFESIVKPGQYYIDEKGQMRKRRKDGAKGVENEATASSEPSTPSTAPSAAGDVAEED
jgi:hypothetical protein